LTDAGFGAVRPVLRNSHLPSSRPDVNRELRPKELQGAPLRLWHIEHPSYIKTRIDNRQPEVAQGGGDARRAEPKADYVW